MNRTRDRSLPDVATKVVAVLLLAVTGAAAPSRATALTLPQASVSVTSAPTAASAGPEERDRTYRRRTEVVVGALEAASRASTRADSLRELTLAVDTAQALVLGAPDDPESHYLYAVAVGQRLELSDTREKIQLGAITRAEAEASLALDPRHAGAHHVLGRLNAATMRMGRVARFVARHVLGADALRNVSWESAENHFANALAIEPQNPRHAMEYGVLLADTDREEEAVLTLRYAIEQPQRSLADSLAVARAVLVLETLECGTCATRPRRVIHRRR